MHLKSIVLHPEKYPADHVYPFCLPIFKDTKGIEFATNVTFFAGENGTGKSSLLEAIARRCGVHIWSGLERTRFSVNHFEKDLHRYIDLKWSAGKVPGSFFASEIFRNFSQNLDEWASTDPGQLDYFGGESLMDQSHGQSHMSFFKTRYRIKGIYFLDEPENALSPSTQIDLLSLLMEMGGKDHAQFIIATHSPILLACPGAKIYGFDSTPVKAVKYEETKHYQIYKHFLNHKEEYLENISVQSAKG